MLKKNARNGWSDDRTWRTVSLRIRKLLLHEAELDMCHVILTLTSRANKRTLKKSAKKRNLKMMKKSLTLKILTLKVQTRKLTKRKIWTNHQTSKNMSMDGMSSAKARGGTGLATTNVLAITLDHLSIACTCSTEFQIKGTAQIICIINIKDSHSQEPWTWSPETPTALSWKVIYYLFTGVTAITRIGLKT